MFSCLGIPSGSTWSVRGRSYATQCTQLPDGASGSSTIKAKLWVLDGASIQESAGEMSEPWQENWAGIFPSASKAGLFSANPAGDARAARGRADGPAASERDPFAGAALARHQAASKGANTKVQDRKSVV